MRIVVLGGCGDMGRYVVEDLIEHTAAHVIVVDRRLDSARAYAARFGERASALAVDARDSGAIRDVLTGAKVAVNCIGPNFLFAEPIARAAIDARTSLVDICDDWGPIDAILGMDDDAKAAGVTIVNGLGWTPGLTNLMARAGAAQLDEVDEVRISWGGGAADSEGLAVVMHVAYAVTGLVPTFRGGERVEVPARSEAEVVEFPAPLGRVHVSHCGHPEPLTIPRYLPVKTVTLKGGLTPDWNNRFAAMLDRLGLFGSSRRIRQTATAIHALEGLFRVGGVPWSGARVDLTGRVGGEVRSLTYTAVDKMGRLTGVPAAIGAAMIARRKLTAHGVYAPEGIIDPVPFFAELAKRNVIVNQPAAGDVASASAA